MFSAAGLLWPQKERAVNRMHAIVLAVVALTVGAAAQQDRKSDSSNVSGVWQMNVEAGHVIQIGMELKQDGTTVSGSILMPAQHVGQRTEVALTGEFVDGSLTLTGTAEGGSDDTAK